MSSSDEQVEVSQKSQKPIVTRACDLCRAMKVRCIPDLNKRGTCQRCVNTNRECVFKPIATRRKKRTDTRVADLEREVQAMRALLERSATSSTPESKKSDHTSSGMWDTSSSVGTGTQSTGEQQHWEGSPPMGLESQSNLQPHAVKPVRRELPYATDAVFVCTEDDAELPLITPFSAQDLKDLDVIDRGVLSMETAQVLLDIFRNELQILAPFIIIHESTSAEDLRKAKPILFLAIMGAASGKHDPELFKILNSEVRQIYATSLMGQKSLELVQSMLVTAVWYFPPASCRQVKYYEYTHMAATMALDIGIGTKPRKNGVGPSWEVAGDGGVITDFYSKMKATSESAQLENRRTFLACYIMCSE
jgi:hypothetical protein